MDTHAHTRKHTNTHTYTHFPIGISCVWSYMLPTMGESSVSHTHKYI